MSDTAKPGFFYRLFMLRSPRSGMMFGLAMMLLYLALLPKLLIPAATNPAVFLWTLLTIILYIIGIIFCGTGSYGILKNVFKSKALNIVLAFLAALIPPLGGLLLLLPLFKSKRFVPALFALAGAVVYSISAKGLVEPFTAIFWGTVLIIIALLGMEDENPCLKWFALPLGVTVLMQFLLIYEETDLQVMIRERREYLGRLTGRPIEISDFWERDAKGYPRDSEPLKTMLVTVPEAFFDDDKVTWQDVEKAQKENSAFVKALEEFLRMPVSHVAHVRPKDELLTSLDAPELSMFRAAARLTAMKIHALPRDKKNVTSANAALITLRESARKGPFLLSLLTSRSIESCRLNALSKVIACGEYSKAEIIELVGDTVEWNATLLAAYAAEAISFETVINHVTKTAGELYDPIMGKVSEYLPSAFRIQFSRDYRFALQNYINFCSQEESLSGVEKTKASAIDEDEARRNGYIFSMMLLPTLNTLHARIATCSDHRQMVLLAAEVMEYYKQHGKLPADLKFLPEIPRAELDHLPFMFEKTKDGFRIYTRDNKGNKPKISAPNCTYQVKLPRNTTNKDKN